MKKILPFFILFVFIQVSIRAQVAINTDGSRPDASAMLDITSTTRGVLVPRLNTAQMQAIPSPKPGLLVYNTDFSSFVYYKVDPITGNPGWIGLVTTDETALKLPYIGGGTFNAQPGFTINASGSQPAAYFGNSYGSTGQALHVYGANNSSAAYFEVAPDRFSNAISTSGGVSINAEDTSAALTVAGYANQSHPHIAIHALNSDTGYLSFRALNPTNFWQVKAYNNSTNADRLGFYNSTTGNVMSLTGDGRVGIGTQQPGALLQVNGISTVTVPQLLLQNNQDGYARLSLKNTNGNNFWSIAGYNSPQGTAGDNLNFYNGTSGNIMTLTGDSKVGIGTANPNASLQVTSISDINNPQLLLYNNANGYARLSLQNSNSQNYWTIAGYNSVQGADELNFFNSQSQQGNIMSITSDGKVGINTAQPVQALDVNGNTNVQGGINFIGPLSMGTNAGETGQVLTSNGPGLPPQWKTVGQGGSLYNSVVIKTVPLYFHDTLQAQGGNKELPFLEWSFHLAAQAKVLIHGFVEFSTDYAVLGGSSNAEVGINYNNTPGGSRFLGAIIPNGYHVPIPVDLAYDFPPGDYSFKVSISSFGRDTYLYDANLTYQLISQ